MRLTQQPMLTIQLLQCYLMSKYIHFKGSDIRREELQFTFTLSLPHQIIYSFDRTKHVLATQTVTKEEFRSSQTHEFEAMKKIKRQKVPWIFNFLHHALHTAEVITTSVNTIQYWETVWIKRYNVIACPYSIILLLIESSLRYHKWSFNYWCGSERFYIHFACNFLKRISLCLLIYNFFLQASL